MRLQIAIIASGVLSRRRRARGLIASWMAASLVLASATPSPAQTFPSSTGNIILETVAKGLDHPWALAFLPDGRLLVTERPGRMRIVANEGKISPAIAGVPKVFASGQGGLHDVILDRDYADNHTIYFCYAEPAGGGGRTALARARLLDEGMSRLDDVAVILHQEGPLSSGNHFGCRIVQTPDNNLFLTWASTSRRATRRRILQTISARSFAFGRTARCRRIILSSGNKGRNPKSGASDTAILRVLPFIP